MDIKTIKQLFTKADFFTQKEIDLLKIVYSFPEHSARASDIYMLLGYKKYPPVNALVGRMGKKIASEVNIPLSERYNGTYRGWDVLFNGRSIGVGGWLWTLKDEYIQILEEMNMVEEDFNSDEKIENPGYEIEEGNCYIRNRVFYERNPIARKKCIEYYGWKCYICRFDFLQIYGEVGRGFIEVHHIVPISEINGQYTINPIRDLRPVCSNCHSMIHRKKGVTIDVEALRDSLQNRRYEQF